jgi:hypothetical protein
MLLMIVFAIAAAWALIAVVVAGLCASAARGDRSLAPDLTSRSAARTGRPALRRIA